MLRLSGECRLGIIVVKLYGNSHHWFSSSCSDSPHRVAISTVMTTSLIHSRIIQTFSTASTYTIHNIRLRNAKLTKPYTIVTVTMDIVAMLTKANLSNDHVCVLKSSRYFEWKIFGFSIKIKVNCCNTKMLFPPESSMNVKSSCIFPFYLYMSPLKRRQTKLYHHVLERSRFKKKSFNKKKW